MRSTLGLPLLTNDMSVSGMESSYDLFIEALLFLPNGDLFQKLSVQPPILWQTKIQLFFTQQSFLFINIGLAYITITITSVVTSCYLGKYQVIPKLD